MWCLTVFITSVTARQISEQTLKQLLSFTTIFRHSSVTVSCLKLVIILFNRTYSFRIIVNTRFLRSKLLVPNILTTLALARLKR